MTSDRAYSGTLAQGTGGQCYGCPYRAPVASAVGTFSINFTDETHAIITMLGETITVQREDFANYTVTPDAMYGEWSFTTGEPILPVYFGDRISFAGPYAADLTVAQGARTGSPLNVALSNYSPSAGQWLLLIDSSTSYYTAYKYRFTGLNRIEGQAWTYLKTDTLSGSGLYFVAHRTKSQARVKGINAPGVTKSFPMPASLLAYPAASTSRDDTDRLQSTYSMVGPASADALLFRDLQARMAEK